jgi:glycosyltransferase involved in cell wall biosynthesis
MKKKLISVLITNYNKEKFLKRSLNSVCNQNFHNYEIILYDDCSSDRSIDIINKYKKVRLIKNLKRSKKSHALNQIKGVLEAFNRSKGDIICLMDSDDYFNKNKLKEVFREFTKNKNINCIFNLPESNKNQFNLRDYSPRYSVWPTIFPTSCISFKRTFFIKFAKYLEKNKYKNLEIDARLTIFSKFFFNKYDIINKKLTFYSYDNEGITSNIKKFSRIWWIRRREAFIYLKYIMKKKNLFFTKSIDYYVTFIISYFVKSL